MTVQCCICKKVKVDGEWNRIWSDLSAQQVSHTYCPRCLHGTVQAMRREVMSANRAQPAVT